MGRRLRTLDAVREVTAGGQELQTFRRQYPEALTRYRGADHEVIFPTGTYAMRVRFGLCCHPPT